MKAGPRNGSRRASLPFLLLPVNTSVADRMVASSFSIMDVAVVGCFISRSYLWEKASGVFHVFTIFVAKLFDEIGFFFRRADCHWDERQRTQRGNEPAVCHHSQGDEQSRPKRIQWMSDPAVRTARDKLMFFASRAGHRDPRPDAAEQPVDPQRAENTHTNPYPTYPF